MKVFKCVFHHCDLQMREYSSLTWMGVRGERATTPFGAPFKLEQSLSCLRCQGAGKETLHGKHHSSYGRASNSVEVGQFFHSLTPACAGQPTEWTRGLCSWDHSLPAWPNEEDSSARLSERHFLQAASSKRKAVDWLLLNARKSRMCQARAAGERGMNQPKDPYRRQRVAAGLLLPVGCHAAPHHRATNAFSAGCRSREKESQQQNVEKWLWS